MSNNENFNMSKFGDLFKIPVSNLQVANVSVPRFDATFDTSFMNKINEERSRKEAQRDEWLKNISDNVLAIKNNSDGLIISMDDLIQTIVISNKITEANLLLIEHELEKIKDNGKVNIIDEIKKATIALAAQKGLECGFVFLLKALAILPIS